MMQPGSLANYRIQDDLRRAEAYRRSKLTREGAAREQRAHGRSVGRAILSALLWPIRH
ncbi:MAG TPA: hypothetical protein VEO00_12225 [Actinomycetota bacterium]|nr:hypothetical protein [Actinomycetota bacterium]